MTQRLVSWERLNSLFFLQKKFHALIALKAWKQNQAKAQNANEQISDFFFP